MLSSRSLSTTPAIRFQFRPRLSADKSPHRAYERAHALTLCRQIEFSKPSLSLVPTATHLLIHEDPHPEQVDGRSSEPIPGFLPQLGGTTQRELLLDAHLVCLNRFDAYIQFTR